LVGQNSSSAMLGVWKLVWLQTSDYEGAVWPSATTALAPGAVSKTLFIMNLLSAWLIGARCRSGVPG